MAASMAMTLVLQGVPVSGWELFEEIPASVSETEIGASEDPSAAGEDFYSEEEMIMDDELLVFDEEPVDAEDYSGFYSEDTGAFTDESEGELISDITEAAGEAETFVPEEQESSLSEELLEAAPDVSEEPGDSPDIAGLSPDENEADLMALTTDVNETSITGISGSTFRFVVNSAEGYKTSYPFQVIGAGGAITSPANGDLRYIPLTYTLGSDSPVDLTLSGDASAPTTAEGELFSSETIRDGSALNLSISLKEQIYKDGGWTDSTTGDGTPVIKTVTKEAYVNTEKLPVASKVYGIVSGRTGAITDYVTYIPYNELQVQVSNESILSAALVSTADNTYKITINAHEPGTSDIKVIWQAGSSENYTISTFRINVREAVNLYITEGETYTETLELPSGAEIICTSSAETVATVSAGAVTKDGDSYSSVITISTNEINEATYSLITVKEKASNRILKEYYVRLHSKQSGTLKKGQRTKLITFTSKTEPVPSLVNQDENIAKGTDLAVTEFEENGETKYRISFRITTVNTGGPVKITLCNKNVPQKAYLITVNPADSDLFSDVTDPSQFYFYPVYWAVDNGITTGFNDNTFRPTSSCNRAAVVTFLWRLAGEPAPTRMASFSDMTDNSDFNKAISWASEQGITTGFNDNTFRPWTTCNRAAIVTFIWRYAGKPEPSKEADFTDMTDNDEFNKAISWASENGITTGYTDGTFRPWAQCSRLAIVTFLYRYAHL